MFGVASADFFSLSKSWPVRRVYVRNLRPTIGQPHSLGNSIEAIAASLAGLVGNHGPVVFAGGSLGGFHALLLGALLGIDRVLALGPSTSIRPEVLEAAGDHRWDDYLAAATPGWVSKYGDISEIWRKYARTPTRLHYSYRHREYCFQAEHLADEPNVTLVPHYNELFLPSMVRSGALAAELSAALFPFEKSGAALTQ